MKKRPLPSREHCFLPRGRWLCLLLVPLVAALAIATASAQAEHEALVLQLEGPLTPSMAQYLRRGLQTAESRQAALVVLELNTPGGSLALLQDMVAAIRNSRVPVLVYVAPRGAMAGSAGSLLTLAGHWAAMAPETVIGAASPVGAQGEDLGKTEQAKAQAVIAALARSLAERRGPRARQAAESMVTQAKAFSAQQALEIGLIDFIAPSLDDALTQLAGREALTAAGRVVLPAHLQAVPLPPTPGESLFHTLTNPNIVFILLGLGTQALLVAFWHPHNWVAWFIGVAALLLAAYGMSLLPVNWVGLAFMLLAFAMFAVDVKATTHGALTAAGVAAFIFGALTLFNTPLAAPQQRVSVPLVVGSGLAAAAVSTFMVALAVRAQQQPVKTGRSRLATLVGKQGVARTPLQPGHRGAVQVAGELWTATLVPESAPVAAGDFVEVVAVEGMHLQVRALKENARVRGVVE